MTTKEHIQARHAALKQQIEEAQQQYNRLEQTLIQLDRQILAMHGGLQELEQLLQEEPEVLEAT